MPATPDQFANYAVSTVYGGAGGPETPLAAADTTLTLPLGDGANFSASGPFMVQLGTDDGAHELAKCTARSGDTFTLVRGQEGTAAQDWPYGTPVEQVATAGNLANLWSRVANLVYNVRDFGAVGDGVTDDTAAISAAMSAAAGSTTGAQVFFPAGTYLTGPQTIAANVDYVGESVYGTIVQLKSGSNASLFSAQVSYINLAAANKTSPDGSVYGFSFRNLTLDGNASGQTAGPSWVLQFYGYAYVVDNVRIRNGYSGCVQCDWNGPDNLLTGDSIEAQWSNVKIHQTLGGPLLQFGGPHDSQFTNVLVFDGKNAAYDSTGSLTPGIHIGPNAAGVLGSNVHVWDVNLPFLLEAESLWANCVADISNRGSNQGIGVLLLGGLIVWTGGSVFGSVDSFTSSGVVVGQTAGATPKSPYMTQQSGGVTLASAPSKCYLDTLVTQCDNAGINFVNSGGANLFCGVIHNPDNAATGGVQGTPHAGDGVRMRVSGITPDGNITTGGLYRVRIKSKEAFTVADPANGHETIRVDTQNNRLQVPYGASILGYSDAFTTGTWSINKNGAGEVIASGYLAAGQSAAAAALATGGTITTAGVGVARVAPAAAVTGVILQSGTVAGQLVTVVNESANSVTFAASGTSKVADGTSDVIAATTAATFVWDSATSLWYRSK